MAPIRRGDRAGRDPTLASLLHDERVDWGGTRRARPLAAELVGVLLGVVPNCDRYLEIWPPAFRTYNVMVPNLLNLPVPIFGVGGPPPGVVGSRDVRGQPHRGMPVLLGPHVLVRDAARRHRRDRGGCAGPG